MNNKYLIPFIISLHLLIAISCITVKNNSSVPFLLKDAFYYSWVAGENEKGTDIFIIVGKLDSRVRFDSLIFHDTRTPVFVTVENEVATIKGILPVGLSRVKIETTPDPRPDQLIWYFNEQRHSFPLEKIRREETKYFNK
jgi:hypothetical protein